MKQDSLNSQDNVEGAFERIFELSPDCMLKIKIADFSFVAVNQQACACYGYTKSEFCALNLDKIGLNQHAKEKIFRGTKESKIGEVIEVEGLSRGKDGIVFSIEIRYCKIDEEYALAIVRKVLAEKKVEILWGDERSDALKEKELQNKKLQLNQDILRMVAQHRPLKEILRALSSGMENLMVGMKVSILLLEARELVLGAAPSLAQGLVEIIDGIPVGPNSYPCGIATYRKEQLIIEDVETNPLCISSRGLAKKYNIKACWSTPIISSDRIVLGTFAMYFPEKKKPTEEAMDFIRLALDLAEVAIDQSYHQESLKKLNKEYSIQNKELELAKLQLENDKKILVDREEKLKEAQRLSGVGSWEFNLETKELLWSEQQYRAYDLEPSSDQNLYDVYRERVSEKDALKVREAIRNAIKGDPYFQYEHEITSKNGTMKYILGMGRIVKNHAGNPILIKGTEQDITELKLAQNAAIENELRFNELMLNINEIVFIVDLKDSKKYDNPITYINGDTIEIFGYTHEELKATASLWTDRIHQEDIQAVMKKGERLHATGQQVIREYRFKHKKGHYLWIEDNVSVGLTEDGKHTRLYGSARDITKRKESEAALLESTERLEMVTQAAKLGIYDWHVVEDVVHWDAQMYSIFELEFGADIGNKNDYVTELIHPDDKERAMNTFAVNFEADQPITEFINEYRAIINGKEKHLECQILFFRNRLGCVYRVIGTCLDITERKKYQVALLESKERLQMVTQAAKLGSYDWHLGEGVVHWDDRMYTLFGLEVNAEIADKNEYIASVMHPDDRERIISTFLANTINNKTETLFTNEYRIIINGQEKHLESEVMLVRDKSGAVCRVIGTCLDITERKEAEALLISNEEKDVLLKEIHHRVKNNLQVITSLLSLQSSYLTTDEQKKLFADSQYRINSMAIVHEMLYQSDNLSKLDYQDYLNELSQFLIRSVKGANNNVELLLDVPRIHLGIDTAIPLGLLITEILTNSLKYGIKGDDAGIINIRIIKKLKEDEKAKSSFILEIGDNGAGYSEDINFRTTNSLGLRLINNLTRQLEGTLTKDNSKKGTNYVISFKEI